MNYFLQPIGLFFASAIVIAQTGAQTSAQAPNVIVIVSDDAGYADFEFMDGLSGENSVVPTPRLDELAKRGVTFSRAYVGQSCQPTRAALVTGGYQNRIGNEVVGNNVQGLPVTATTIFDRMKSVNYTTGAVGKWHLGSVDGVSKPQSTGVDEFYGIWHGSRSYFGGGASSQTQVLREAIVQSNGTVTDTVVESAHAGEYVTTTFGDYAVDFINDHHSDADPFFLYQSFTAPHTPLQNSPDFNDPRLSGLSGDQKTYASMMLTMDTEIGRIMDRLDDPNGDGNTSDSIRDDTMIVFVNDNGGADAGSSSPNGADNGVFRRGKGTPYEGGIRVPMIIAGAGVAASAVDTVYDKPVHGVDILPTAFAAAGGSFGAGDTGIDGVNLLPFINGTDTADPHDVLVNRHRKQFTVIKGDWTLVNSGGSSTNSHQLFNLATDISQTTNVRAANPETFAELTRDLTAHEAVFDKQRYAILGRTDESTINLFDHFTFRPGVQTNWSGTGAWVEGGTNNVETMFNSDAFAGAVLEFTTSANNYTSNNNMVRETGLEYMLNKIVLSGSFNGAANRSGTIQGNDLLFTKDLPGVGPQISIESTKTGNADFNHNVDLNLIMYDDLTITGNGNGVVNINGQISDYFDARNLTKSGTSTVALAGDNTYAGNTFIQEGTLAIVADGALSNTPLIEVQAGATFDVSATTNGSYTLGDGQTLSGSGTVLGNVIAASGSTIGPGSDVGQLSITGALVIDVGATLEFELGGTAGSEFDQLSVGGILALNGGDLMVTLETGFTATAGNVFEILDVGTWVGNFDSIQLPTLSAGLEWDTSQLASLGELRVEGSIPGDFDNDGDVDIDDIDSLSANMGQPASTNPAMDLNDDSDITLADHDLHITTLLQTDVGTGALIGDINLDGDVDVSQFDPTTFTNVGDASILLSNLGTTSGASYGDGDLNGDGDVDISQFDPVTFTNVGDASRLLANLGQNQTSGGTAAASVPEPSSMVILAAAAFGLISGRRKRSTF